MSAGQIANYSALDSLAVWRLHPQIMVLPGVDMVLVPEEALPSFL